MRDTATRPSTSRPNHRGQGVGLWTTISLVLVTLCTSACVPYRDYSVAQIATIDDLDELMHVMATVADDRMDLAASLADDAVTAEHYGAFVDMGTRLHAASERLLTLADGREDFTRWSEQLSSQARLLAETAKASDAAQTLGTAREINATCAACHDAYD